MYDKEPKENIDVSSSNYFGVGKPTLSRVEVTTKDRNQLQSTFYGFKDRKKTRSFKN
jgi:hypothetical protein